MRIKEDFSNNVVYSSRIKIMRYIQIYLTSVLLLYIFGPVSWKTQNSLWVYFLLILYQVVFLLGYIHGGDVPFKEKKLRFNSEWLLRNYSILASIAILMNGMYLIRVAKLVSNRGIWDVILSSFTNAKTLYLSNSASSLTSSQMFGGKLFAILVPICGPITTAMIPLTMVFIKQMNRRQKALGITNIIIQVLLSISAGTSEGYFNIIVYLLTGFLLLKRRVKKKRTNKKTIVIMGGLIVAFLIIFSCIMVNRNQGSFALSLGGNNINWSNPLLNVLPVGMQATLVYLTIYVTQGYYGFSLATTCEWNPTFGVGHSLYLLQNIEEVFNSNIMDITYMGQAEKYGWGATVNWHSAYTWIANDVSFVGVIFVMFFMGWLLNRVYKDAYENRNPIAIGLFTTMVMFCFFIPANNKVFAAPQTFVTFWLLLIIWLFQRKFRLGNIGAS